MKKIWIKIAVLFPIFIAALVVSSLVTNKNTEETVEGMEAPTLPTVSFYVAGSTVNQLSGYTQQMDMTSMRDTITPLSESRVLEMDLQRYRQLVSRVSYEVWSLDGEELYLQREADAPREDKVFLNLADGLKEDVSEAVLKVAVETEKNGSVFPVYYYTRIEPQEGLSINRCLEFAKDFHQKTFEAGSGEDLELYLEPGEESSDSYQTVDIHSDITHIQWGNLKPQVSTEVLWDVKESNSVYTSLLARYQVVCTGEQDRTETYNVREFFRVRDLEGQMYLLNYERTMGQVFNWQKGAMDEKGIYLGSAGQDFAYAVNEKNTAVAFVQERELWIYRTAEEEFTRVFSFADTKRDDLRSWNDGHEIRILSVENNGSAAFAVYGYMNCGSHEGSVGAGIYYYDSKSGVVEEKAFISSTKSHAIARRELGQMVYYSQRQDVLYVLAGDMLYQVDLADGQNHQTVLAEGLSEGKYMISEDGSLLAYQTDGSKETANQIEVLDMAGGGTYTVAASVDETICPLGFVYHDVICGYMRNTDKGNTAAGEELLPMYKLEIRNGTEGVLKTYMQEGVYITDVEIENNLITLNRVIRNDNIYQPTGADYITNNEERKDGAIVLEETAAGGVQKQLRFTLKEGVKDLSPRILRAGMEAPEVPVVLSFDMGKETGKYYVYGMGELAGIYLQPAAAIQKAEEVSGVVISSDQSYVWEKGNRDLAYDIEMEPFSRTQEQSAMEACEAYMSRYEAERLDLTGCSLDQIFYILNKGLPVIAMTAPGHGVLLTGYDMTGVSYVEPDDGTIHTVSIGDMRTMTEQGGKIFIGYLK